MGKGGFSWLVMLLGVGVIWNVGVLLSQLIFYGGVLFVQCCVVKVIYEVVVDQYKQVVFGVFQNVVDLFVVFEYDVEVFEVLLCVVLFVWGVYDDVVVCVWFGVLLLLVVCVSELQYCNVWFDEIWVIGVWFVDIVWLYQVMGMQVCVVMFVVVFLV